MTFTLNAEVAAVLAAVIERSGPPPAPPAGDVASRRVALDAMPPQGRRALPPIGARVPPELNALVAAQIRDDLYGRSCPRRPTPASQSFASTASKIASTN